MGRFFKPKQTESLEVVVKDIVNNSAKQHEQRMADLTSHKEIAMLKSQMKNYQNEFGITIRPQTHAGEKVTVKSAMGLDTVYACIRDKAESIGQLPIIVKRNGEKLTRGKREYKIFAQQPNDYMTTQDLVEMYVTCMEARGNFYMLPIYNKFGNIAQLLPFRFQENVVPEMDTNGRVYYTYTTNDGKPKIEFASNTLIHIKLNSLDGIRGLSPISTAASAFGIAMAQESHLESLMSDSAMPKGVLYTDTLFDNDDAIKRLQKQWSDSYGGVRKSGKTPLLEHGLKYQAIGLSPADSELIKQRIFSKAQICAIFRVPASRMNVPDAMKFNTLEENNRSYLRDSLIPIITKFENAINNRLPDNMEIMFDVTKYARGDRESQVNALKAEFSTGAISMNEMREDLGRDAAEGGDVHAIDTNNFTFGSLTDIPKLQEQARLLAEQAQQKPPANQVEGEEQENA